MGSREGSLKMGEMTAHLYAAGLDPVEGEKLMMLEGRREQLRNVLGKAREEETGRTRRSLSEERGCSSRVTNGASGESMRVAGCRGGAWHAFRLLCFSQARRSKVMGSKQGRGRGWRLAERGKGWNRGGARGPAGLALEYGWGPPCPSVG